MSSTVLWRVFSDARSINAARRVGNRVLEALGLAEQPVEIAPYPKTGGHTITFTGHLGSSHWPDMVFSVLVQAQRVGHGWELHGSIVEELDLVTNKVGVSGVSMIHCRATRTDQSHETR